MYGMVVVDVLPGGGGGGGGEGVHLTRSKIYSAPGKILSVSLRDCSCLTANSTSFILLIYVCFTVGAWKS